MRTGVGDAEAWGRFGVAARSTRLAIQPGDRPGLWVVIGEVDGSNVRQLGDHLQAAAQLGDQVVLDMARVGFIDLAGVALLVDFARRLPESGTLTLREAPALVADVLSVFGWEQEPRLRLAIRRD